MSLQPSLGYEKLLTEDEATDALGLGASRRTLFETEAMMGHEIIFRLVEPKEFLITGAPAWADDPESTYEAPHWYVSFLDLSLPIGIAGTAYVIEWPDIPVKLDYLYVDEGSRRSGIGTKLVEACIDRWPGIRGITSEYAGTPEGEKFCEALEQRPNGQTNSRGRTSTRPQVLRRVDEVSGNRG